MIKKLNMGIKILFLKILKNVINKKIKVKIKCFLKRELEENNY